MIEDLMTELISALRENTAAVKAATTPIEASVSLGNINPEPEKRKRAAAKLAVVEPPAGEPTAETEDDDDTPTLVVDGTVSEVTPTKVDAPKAAKDTPHVPAPSVPGQPQANEHVDVDEVISSINTLVKAALQSAEDVAAVKKQWETIRKGYGVDRISDLLNDPASLLAALAQAKKL